MLDILDIIPIFLIFLLITLLIAQVILQFNLKKKQRIYEEKLSKSNIAQIDNMDGYEFEHYLVALFKEKGYNVKRTQSSSDFGADLIIFGDQKIVIQAKRYSKKVGIKAVQEINAAKSYYNANESWVITNNFFTKPAIKLALSTNTKLIDREKLMNLIIDEPA